MNTKLTLRLDEDLIQQAKQYAAHQGRSVSDLVAAYFSRLADGGTQLESTKPSVANARRRSAFRGLIAGSKMDESAYREHLKRKHQ